MTTKLFDQGAVERRFDTPEFRGITFYEVRAKSIINRVPESVSLFPSVGPSIPIEDAVTPASTASPGTRIRTGTSTSARTSTRRSW
jgi:hypothetical protein